MTRDEARAYVQLHAATTTPPALTAEQVEACLDAARVVDRHGNRICDEGYTETIDGPRAVVNVIDAKLAAATATVDTTADGTTLALSQVTANLSRLRRTWAARLVPGGRR